MAQVNSGSGVEAEEEGGEEWTPDRYLQELEAFLESNAADLFGGKRTLRLHPRGLELLNSRLGTLARISDLSSSEQPFEYIRAYVSDINDHQRLERIQNVLCRLSKMKLTSLSKSRRDPTPVDLTRFRFLTSLEVYKCDLSTHPAVGLAELRPRLANLVISNSVEALRHIFSPCGSEEASEGSSDKARPREWQKLATVRCIHNSCTRMDSSLTLLTCVKSLDLSGNSFKVMENLHNCVNLMSLDLSYNRISSTARLNERCGNLTQLKLKCNSLTSTDGIDKLYSLEVLDLSGNLISKFAEVSRLSALPFLEALWLADNPISYAKGYRTTVLSFFPTDGMTLDSQKTTPRELQAIAKQKKSEAAKRGVLTSEDPPKAMKREVSAAIPSRRKPSRIVEVGGAAEAEEGRGSVGGAGQKTSWMWSSAEAISAVDPPAGEAEPNPPRPGPNSPPRWSQDQLIRYRPRVVSQPQQDDASSSTSSSSSFGVYSDSEEEGSETMGARQDGGDGGHNLALP